MEVILLFFFFPMVILLGCLIPVIDHLDKRKKQKEAEAAYEAWLNRYGDIDTIMLSQSQIEDIQENTQLPCLLDEEIPSILDPDEVAVYYAIADLVKKKYYTGRFFITTKRVVFTNDEKGFDLLNKKISAFFVQDQYIVIQSGRSVFQLELARPELVKTVFDAVITNSMPIESMGEDEFLEEDLSYLDESLPLSNMDGHQFEYYCADLLRKNGFSKVEVTPGSGDQGVDVLSEKDGVKYAIQCKKYSSPLGNTPVQEVNAGKTYYNCHVAVVMTNSTFTKSATKLAAATGVLLWDGMKIKEFAENL